MNKDSRLLAFMDKVCAPNKFTMKTFDDRIFFQKIVYIGQEMGFDFGSKFIYNWYKRGPYSPDLAQRGHSIESTLERFLTKDEERESFYAELKENEDKIIRDIKVIIYKKLNHDISKLELLVSLDYIFKNLIIDDIYKSQLEYAIAFLKDTKPQLSRLFLDKTELSNLLFIMKDDLNWNPKDTLNVINI